MSTSNASAGSALSGWYVILCRPAGENRALADRLRALGAQTICLPAFRIAAARDPARAREALRGALGCQVVIFSSPNAVRWAAELLPNWVGSNATAVAVGKATARTLKDSSWQGSVVHPERTDSEGVLALPELDGVSHVGLVTAPGGRGLIEQGLGALGIELRRADVYRRVPLAPRPSSIARLANAAGHLALLASSEQAMQHLWRRLPAASLQRLRESIAVVSSARLRDGLLQRGIQHVELAHGPSPAQLVDALSDFAQASSSCSIKSTAPPIHR